MTHFSPPSQLKVTLLDGYRTLRLPFFADLTDDRLKQAALACKLYLSIVPNQELFKQGEDLDAFHVIVDGQVLC